MPLHPRRGSCSLARHGTYRRKKPAGALIARWYCPQSHTTFSLLPDCLAARLPGTLQELEAVVAHAEQAASLMQAADQVRGDGIELPGAMRWLRRRVRLVRQVLRVVIGLLPQHLAGCRHHYPDLVALPGARARTLRTGANSAPFATPAPASSNLRYHAARLDPGWPVGPPVTARHFGDRDHRRADAHCSHYFT